MRDIKFRAWDKSNDMMREIIEIRFNNDGRIKSVFPKPTEKEEFYGECNDWPNDYELMQYTGIKDKDGREIYDGDIISFTERTINGGAFTHVCKVFQSESGAWRVEGRCVDFKNDYTTRRELYSIRHFCEIIGNIYENPELLEGVKDGN